MADQREYWDYFLELHSGNPQEGPGEFEATRRAFGLVDGLSSSPRILDLGCGPGRQTLDLLRLTNGTVTAVDSHAPFLEQLQRSAAEQGVADRVTTVVADMATLDLEPASFDLVWSEGALYAIGFEAGLQLAFRMLRPGGSLAASELTRLRPGGPAEAVEFWETEYPAIRDVDGNLALLDAAGYERVGHFVLPESAWRAYYEPLAAKFEAFRTQHAENPTALMVLAHEAKEQAMYFLASEFYGYVFHVARRPAR
ncbi:MAG: class I SAM-dependent methyltransferase [Planctomycetota bacterium]